MLVWMLASVMGGDPLKETPQEAKPEEKGFFLWTDTSLSLLAGDGFEVDPDAQTTLTVEHAHGSAIGDLFGFLDITDFHDVHGGPEMTWYAEIGPRLSAGKILEKDLSFSILPNGLFEFKDLLLAAQYERGEDPDVAEAVLLGVGVDLSIREAGMLGLLGKFNYIQLNIYGRAELTEGVDRGFEDIQVTLAAGYPVVAGAVRVLIDGYFDWVLGLGSEESGFHLNPQVKLDLGNFWGKPERIYAGVELDVWRDKYQIPDSSGLDTDQSAASLILKVHF